MSLNLLLLRHAEAEDKKSGTADFDRELTPKGINQCLILGNRLKQFELKPDYLISSPSARTVMTTSLVLKSWEMNVEIDYDESIYHGDETRLLEIIRQLKPEKTCAILVGHNPTISGLASILHPDFKSGLDTCTLLWIEFDASEWKSVSSKNSSMKQFMSPKNLNT